MSHAEEYLTRLYALLGDGTVQRMMREYITEQCAAERQRCAKIADLYAESEDPYYRCCASAIAAKIRSGE